MNPFRSFIGCQISSFPTPGMAVRNASCMCSRVTDEAGGSSEVAVAVKERTYVCDTNDRHTRWLEGEPSTTYGPRSQRRLRTYCRLIVGCPF